MGRSSATENDDPSRSRYSFRHDPKGFMDASVNLQSYVDLGWSVFPVKGPYYGKDYNDTKKPIEAWKPFQTRKPTPAEISTWIASKPKMSVGAVTGPISGFIVVDIDSQDWVKAFPNADFGETWKSLSKRGCHYFYAWDDWMLKIPSTGSEIGDIKGFDIRGLGGYVVVPNENDLNRRWAVSPDSCPIAPMPEWIKKFLLQSLENNQNGNGKKSVVPLTEITEGNRHSAFLSYAGKLNKAGMSPSDILAILGPVARANAFESELSALVLDVANRYPVNRREALRPESMEALLMEPEPPLEWMIDGLWTDVSKGFIAGHPGVGKTWIALDMLISIATGTLCMGKYKPCYSAPVLLVEEEASRRNLQRRIHAMSRARGLEASSLRNLYHITRQFPSMPRDLDELLAIVRDRGVRFVVFDSLRTVHSAKENSSDEMAVVLKSFSELSILGNCSVLLIHHLAKSGIDNDKKSIFEKMRGTGSLWAWRDCILGIEGEEDSAVSQCSFQFRDAESPAPIKIRRSVGITSGAIGLEAIELVESDDFVLKVEAVKSFLLTQFGAAFKTDIAKSMEGRKADNLSALKLMLKKGILISKEGGKVGVPE
jgi:hypothetical protein